MIPKRIKKCVDEIYLIKLPTKGLIFLISNFFIILEVNDLKKLEI